MSGIHGVYPCLAAVLALMAATGPAAGQQVDSAKHLEGRPLTVGSAVADSLPQQTSHFFEVELDADHFVRGSVDQRSVDVVVTVRDPRGRIEGRFDGPVQGPERFSFQVDEPGTYRLEVAPSENATGRYAIVLDLVEPVATTPEGQVEQLIGHFDGLDTPGGVIGVVRDGRLAFSRAFGAADLSHEVPFSSGTRTNIGSTSKQFTAFAVLLLAERGELSLDDDVREYLPELKDFGTPVTLRHLLTHTSGYREFLNLLAMGGRRLDYDYVDPAELIDIVDRQPELQNAPGEEWNYNNTGYGLLAQVVAKVAGKPFPEWMRENVFLPLGMEHTMVREDPRTIVPHRAMGYVNAEVGGFKEAADLGGAMGAGGIYTTIGDLATWMAHLAEPKLGGPQIIERMTTLYVLADGDTTSYGLGLFVDELRGLRRVHHGGADVAHRSQFVFFPGIDAGFIVLSNYASLPGSIPGGVAETFFEEHFEPEEEPEDDVAGDGEYDPADFNPVRFDQFAGPYELDAQEGFVLTFRREGDTYYTRATGQPELEIVPTSDSTFEIRGVDAAITFHQEGDGPVQRITLHQNGEHPATRVQRAPLTAEELEGYTGRYFSEEVQTYYHVVVEEGELVVRHRRLDDITLEPTAADTFGGGFPLATIRFRRDDSGAVTGFMAANGRTRDVWFGRVEGEGRN